MRVSTLRSFAFLTPSLAMLLAVGPVFGDVAATARDGERRLAHADVTASGKTSWNANGAEVSASFDLLREDDDSEALRGSVTTATDSAKFRMDRDSIAFGDGYSLRREVLVDTATEFLGKVHVFSPSGSERTALVRVNRVTGETSHDDFTDVTSMLRGSHDLAVLASAMPMVRSAIQANASQAASANGRLAPNSTDRASGNKIVAEGFWTCLLEAVAYVADTIGMIAACGAPEPLEPIVCGVAIVGWVAAGGLLADACS